MGRRQDVWDGKELLNDYMIIYVVVGSILQYKTDERACQTSEIEPRVAFASF